MSKGTVLRNALIALNCLLTAAVVGLSAVTFLASREAFPAAGGSQTAGPVGTAIVGQQTADGSGGFTIPEVTEELSFALKSGYGSAALDNGNLYYNAASSLYRVPLSGGTPEFILSHQKIDGKGEYFNTSSGLMSITSFFIEKETLYLCLQHSLPRRSFLTAIPLAGGEAELLLSVPGFVSIASNGGMIYCMGKTFAAVIDPASKKDPIVYPLDILSTVGYDGLGAAADGLYYYGITADGADLGLCRFSPDTGKSERLMPNLNGIDIGNGVMAQGVYYFNSKDDMGESLYRVIANRKLYTPGV